MTDAPTNPPADTRATEAPTFDLDGGRACLDFANTLDSSGEHLTTYADLVAFAAQSDLITPDDARWLQTRARRYPAGAHDVLERARRLRAAVYTIFSDLAADAPPQARALEQLNRELAATLRHARLQPTAEQRRAPTGPDGSHAVPAPEIAERTSVRNAAERTNAPKATDRTDAPNATEGTNQLGATGPADELNVTRRTNAANVDAPPSERASAEANADAPQPSFRWAWKGRELDTPLWGVIRSAADLLTNDQELPRIRECGGAECRWLFLDTSKNRTRQWCSMQSCGNRQKARRHYQRLRKVSPTASTPGTR